MRELPGGTVTFLFTDIGGSTRLVRELGERYGEVLAGHRGLLRSVFEEHGGEEVEAGGDSLFVVFRRARDAVAAALAGQEALAAHRWPDGAEVRVRMGIHTGEPAVSKEGYLGLAVHRAARICAAGHGGQILVSQATHGVLEDERAGGAGLRDLGEHRLKDFERPERIFQVVAPGLAEDFPPLKTPEAQPDEATAFAGREGALAETAQAALLVSDAEREQAALLLREHCAAGRLTLEEFSERVGAVYAARTYGELEAVAADLPAEAPARSRRSRTWLVLSALGRVIRRGRWRPGRFVCALSLFGDLDLDLRQAEIGRRGSTLLVFALFGNVDVYVPEGVDASIGSLVLFGHWREWGRDEPRRGAPPVRVRVLALFGTADLWRVPAGAPGSFREVIALVRSRQRELTSAGDS